MKLSRSLALGVGVALALPALASAHPAVYSSQQYVLRPGDTCRITDAVNNDACITDAQRTTYAVGNDGFAMAFIEGSVTNPVGATSETNGAPAGRGMINYRFLPGTWRGTATPANRLLWLAYGPAQTELQPHATCLGAAWDTPTNILAWQEDPFYDYIPWQKTSVGIGDEPSEWLPVVKNLTGVDLSTLSTPAEFEAACEAPAVGGTYYPADTASKITSALETSIKAPLESQITTLQGSLTTLQAQKTAVDAQLAAALAPKPAAPRALALTLSAKQFDQGVAMVTGNPGAVVTVRAQLSSADAKKLKVARTISSKKATINADGAALVNLALTAKAAKAVDKHRPSLKVTIDAAAGGVTKTATGTLTR